MMTSPSTIKLTDTVLKFLTPNSDAKIELIGSQRTQHIRTDKGKKIATDDDESLKKLVPALKVIREDPDKPIRVPYMINGKMHYLTNDEINAHNEKEDKIKKAVKEAKMFKKPRLKVTELDELELGIQSALPAPIPEQALSQSSGRKRKHMELEPKIKVPGLECNRSLPEGVPFVNNMVIEEHEYGIFFTVVFGDQAFQRWNDIYKVGMDSMVSYLVMASMNKTSKNATQPDQEKLQSKRVKLEAVGYKLD
ncbi:hypothetical protein Tco_0266116 [Tanacetum coccineum]